MNDYVEMMPSLPWRPRTARWVVRMEWTLYSEAISPKCSRLFIVTVGFEEITFSVIFHY